MTQILVPNFVGQFDSFNEWVTYAERYLTNYPQGLEGVQAVCVDALGRRCNRGGDFMRARDENAFPVRFFWSLKAVDAQTYIEQELGRKSA